MRKAYFKRSKELHPDRHANAGEEEREEFNKKFKQAKEAYEVNKAIYYLLLLVCRILVEPVTLFHQVLSDASKREAFDKGGVKPPPGGWYQVCSHQSLGSYQPFVI